MLTEDEKLFLLYWEKNRDAQSHFIYQLAAGLPFGLMFALPVLVVIIFHGWYKSMIFISTSQLIVIAISVVAVAVFVAVFRMKYKWEHNEQLYKELKSKEGKS